MPKSRPATVPAATSPSARHQQQVRLWQFLILGGVVLGVIAILLYKQTPVRETTPLQVSGVQASVTEAAATSLENNAAPAVIPFDPVAQPQELPEVQLMRALDAGTPALAFFHSSICDSCKEMTAIVAEVYPEFAGSVALVDVDVYDERNKALLRDDGRGFDATRVTQGEDAPRGTGILGMRERAWLLDGTVAIASSPGHGTAVEVHIPYTGACHSA
jgi:hypothetical protein